MKLASISTIGFQTLASGGPRLVFGMDMCTLEGWRSSSSLEMHTKHKTNHAALMFIRKYLSLTKSPDLLPGPQLYCANMTNEIPGWSQPLPKSILHSTYVQCLRLHHPGLSSSLDTGQTLLGQETGQKFIIS